MAYAGSILVNPTSGERFVFHETAGDTGGRLLSFELEVAPGGRVPGAHVHPTQEERFDVVSGTMRFRKGLRTVTAEAGDSVVVPPGTAHRFANAGDEPARVLVRVTPALKMEQLFETVVALAREGRTFDNGMPNRSSWRCSCGISRRRCGCRWRPASCERSRGRWPGWPGAGASTSGIARWSGRTCDPADRPRPARSSASPEMGGRGPRTLARSVRGRTGADPPSAAAAGRIHQGSGRPSR
jgi:quercetin dioxygenase-like cupin family protein